MFRTGARAEFDDLDDFGLCQGLTLDFFEALATERTIIASKKNSLPPGNLFVRNAKAKKKRKEFCFHRDPRTFLLPSLFFNESSKIEGCLGRGVK